MAIPKITMALTEILNLEITPNDNNKMYAMLMDFAKADGTP